MGFNPFRQQKRRVGADVAMLVAAFVVVAVLVGWAVFGGG